MGSVYEAEDATSGRRVAVKLIGPEYSGSPEALQRFRQEGKLASGLAHPRCVFVLAADEEAGRPYIVMELMPGATLDDLVQERGPLPPEEAIAKILDVIDGLREAHRLGLVHRDVKPSNCFLEADGRVKVGDFGLARSLAGSAKLTRTGTFIGTPLFAAPEQIKLEPVDAQSDLYATAATLYFLLTGKAPFQSGDVMATLARIVSEDPPPLRTLRPELSRSLDRVVRRGLARDRKYRYRDLDEFRRALLPFLPARPSIGGTGLRVGAYLLDSLLLTAFGFAAQWAYGLLTGAGGIVSAWTLDPTFLAVETVISSAVVLLYYGLLEGLWGWSLGKRLLRLRVGGVADHHPPGVGRALLRAGLLYALFNVASVATMIVWRAYDLPTDGHPRSEQEAFLIALLSMVQGVWVLLALGLMVSTMRKHNGYRCLHEILSGTRTYRLRWPQFMQRRALRRQPFQLAVARPQGLPAQVGAFPIVGALRWGDRDRTLLAEDPQLSRRLWIRLRPAEDAPELVHHGVSRAGRLRWVGGGTQEGWQWDAFLAPAGTPLLHLAAGPTHLTWAEVRPLLEELTEELIAASTDGTLPEMLSVSQVWVQPEGPAQLLDILWRNDADSSAEMPEDRADDHGRALAFLRRVTITALEGAPRPAGDSSGPVRAPLPVHAADMLRRLFGRGAPAEVLTQWRKDLEATRDQATEVTRGRRAAHLGLTTLLLHLTFGGPFVLLLLPLGLLMYGLRNSKIEADNLGLDVAMMMIWSFPLAWAAWSFAFRGGFAFWRVGLHLCRADGRKAARWQCAGRVLLVWVPVVGLLSLTIVVALVAPQFPWLCFLLWFIAVLLLPLWVVLALLNPARGPHDRLMGTYLVPD
jgi:hypothetical protein